MGTQTERLGAERQLPEGPRADISADAVYEILANRRRRYVISYLQRRDETVTLGTLAEEVAAWETETAPNLVGAKDRKLRYTALQQRHLPRMDDAGLVTFDARAGTVTPTDTLAEIDVGATVARDSECPWGQYYLGLATANAVGLVAVWAAVPAPTVLPSLVWGGLPAAALLVSAVAHLTGVCG
jgi:hypothetical protein